MSSLEELARFHEYLRLDRQRTGEGLTPEQLVRWRGLRDAISRRLSSTRPGGAEEQRESVRVATRIRVSFRSEAGLCEALMTNLSRGGVFINTAFPAEPGSRLELRIRIEESGEELLVPVRVVSRHVGPGLSTGSPGMGCCFHAPPPDVRKRLEDLYERAGLRSDTQMAET